MAGPLSEIGSLWIDGPLSWLEQASIASFVALGHDYVLYTYGTVPNLPPGARLADAREVWANDDIIVHAKAQSPAIHADVFRAIMVRDTGRVWADTDIIALRPFPRSLAWYFGWERSDRPILGNAIMGFPAQSRTMAELAAFLTSEFPIPPWFNRRGRAELEARRDQGGRIDLGELPWGTTGPQALTHFARATKEIGYAQPQGVFFPISFPDRKALTDPTRYGSTAAGIEDQQSLCVHLYSRWLRKFTRGYPPAPGSWLGKHLRDRGLLDADAPAPPPKVKPPRVELPKEKPVPMDTDAFARDYAERRAAMPGGPRTSRHGRLLCITMAKDEGPYVLEWVAYHHLKGFTDILAFTNDCTDGTDEMLDALASIGLVTRVDNPPLGTMPPQSRALKRAQQHVLVKEADWIMVMDFDEFLAIRTPAGDVDSLIDVIEGKGATAMPVTWRFFGSGGQAGYTPLPVVQRFTQAARNDFSLGYGVKTLFRNADHLRLAIHRPRIVRNMNLDGQHSLNWINGSGMPVDGQVMTWRQTRQVAGYDLAQLNHYGVKSGEEYLLRRLRGDVLNNHGKYDDVYFQRYDRNEIEDRTAAGIERDLAAFTAELLAVPAVGAAARLVAERYAAKLERLRGAPDYAAQMRALGLG
jgi:hypothetical protein